MLVKRRTRVCASLSGSAVFISFCSATRRAGEMEHDLCFLLLMLFRISLGKAVTILPRVQIIFSSLKAQSSIGMSHKKNSYLLTKCFRCTLDILLHNGSDEIRTESSILQIRTKPRELNYFLQVMRASKWQGWLLNISSLTAEPSPVCCQPHRD